MKKLHSFLLISSLILFCACDSGSHSMLNGKWVTQKKFRGVPYVILTINMEGSTVHMKYDPEGERQYYQGVSNPKTYNAIGKYIGDDQYEMSNGMILQYYKENDQLYLKRNDWSQQYLRDQ